MATVTLGGNAIATSGNLPTVGQSFPDFALVATDLSVKSKADFAGKKVIYNIFPSIDTPTCAMSVRQFHQKAAALEGVVVVCVSRDLPFAAKRFCGAEGIDDVICLSDFQTAALSDALGIRLTEGPLNGLMARSVFVTDAQGQITHVELVSEIAAEPNYEAALAVL